jgi:spermidine/putrescine transport system substrate-binding protein
VDNAKLFLNFIMDPENAAMISEYTGYGNSVQVGEAFKSAELLAAPEMTIPVTATAAAHFQQTCPPEAQDLYARIWTDVTK